MGKRKKAKKKEKVAKEKRDIVEEKVDDEMAHSHNISTPTKSLNSADLTNTKGGSVGNTASSNVSSCSSSNVSNENQLPSTTIVTHQTSLSRNSPKKKKLTTNVTKKEDIRRVYDINPTVLYKYIENKFWGDVILRCEEEKCEASIWIVRYETMESTPMEEEYESKAYPIRWKMLPVHAAIIFNAPLNVIKCLVMSYPDGLRSKDDRKMLPLHLSARMLSSNDVFNYLLHTFPGGVKQKDYKGRTPGKILLECNDGRKDKEKVTVLMKCMTKFFENNDGKIAEIIKKPIQTMDYDVNPTYLVKLIERKLWRDTIERCDKYPEEASIWMCRHQEVKDKENVNQVIRWKILPLHSAIVLHSPPEVIEALIDAYPMGVKDVDERGMLPLHMAFRLGCDLEISTILVDSYPEALGQKDKKGHTPLRILKAYRKKYQKDKEKNKNNEPKSVLDKNREELIKFYIGRHTYHGSSDCDSGYDSVSEMDSSDDSDISSVDESNIKKKGVETDSLFYKGMLSNFGKLTAQRIQDFPQFVSSALTCGHITEKETKNQV